MKSTDPTGSPFPSTRTRIGPGAATITMNGSAKGYLSEPSARTDARIRR